MKKTGLLSIVKCTPDSAQELSEIARKTFSDTFRHFNDPNDFDAYLDSAFSLSQMRSELANPHSRFYFCHSDGTLAGYLKLNFAKAQGDVKDPESLEVERIYVPTEFQGFGIGAALMRHAITYARGKNMKYLWLGVWEKNPKAIAFYKSKGFEEFDKHYFKIGEDLQTDILMKLSLVNP